MSREASIRPAAPVAGRGAPPWRPRAALRAGRWTVAWLLVVAGVVAGVGWVYGLRLLGVARLGPEVGGALPLQQLAGGEAQPLLRVLLAWVPAGVVVGLVLERLTGAGAVARAALAGATTWGLLVASGAAADAIANSEALLPHVVPQLDRAATWLAAVLVLLGAALVPGGGARRTSRLALLAASIAWLALGLQGTYAYGHHYDVYRGFPPPTDPPGVRAGAVVRVRYRSPALGYERRYALVYEPPGYARMAATGRRFPVLYLLHGGPGKPEHFLTIGDVAVTLDRLYHRRALAPMLVVMPYGRVHPGPPDDEWANTRLGRFEDLVVDTAHAIDRRLATRPDRAHRMLAGLSTGGYGAANITLHHLATFGGFESWSGYFGQDGCCAFRGEPAGVIAANSPDRYVLGLRAALRRHPLSAFLYQGAQDPEPNHMVEFARRLRAAGASVRIAAWPGRHNWRLWRAHLPLMLRWAAARMERA